MNSVTNPLVTRPDELSDKHSKRIQEYSKMWKFYDGDHWDRDRAVERLITFNYSKAIVDKSVSFLFGKGFRIKPHKDYTEIKEMVEEVWQYNNKDITGIEIGQMGAVTGDSFIRVSWENGKKNSQGIPHDLEYPDGKVRIDVLSSSMVFPEYATHNKNEMVSCKIIYVILQKDEKSGKIQPKLYKEEITRDKIKYYVDDKLQKEIDNVVGKINVVHIRNLPKAGKSYGQSDLKAVTDLQKELNEKVTDVSDIINYHAAPITIIKGAKSKNLEKGARKVWGGLPADADVYNLKLESDLGASNKYIGKIKTAISELSNTPEDSLGGESNISNTTGVALRVKYAPLLEKTWIKRRTYGRGIKEVCKLILLYLKVKGDEEQQDILDEVIDGDDPKEIRKLFDFTIKFPDPLPKDELVELQKIAQKLNMGIETPKGALEELGYEGNIQEKLDEIREYQKQAQRDMFDIGSENSAENIDIGGIKSDLDGKVENEQQGLEE